MRNSRSSSFEILLRFEIGRKFEGSDLSRPGFLKGFQQMLEVDAAIGKMKQGKSGGPTEVVSKMLKAAGETGTLWMIDVCIAVVKDDKILEDWSRSWMVNVYKERACGSYRGMKLLEHAMKVPEREIEGRVRKIVKIDSMQFGFMAGRSMTDAIFSPSAAGEIFGKK